MKWSDRYPCIYDKILNTSFDRHYVYHSAWASRILQDTKPNLHVDISSSLYFIAICSGFIPIEFYDYRPANLILKNLSCKSADVTKLHFKDNSIKSLSCMHVIEHIGLGRYGDKLDCNGDLKAINELKRVLALNGDLLIVVPIGKAKIMFNAHRIYSYRQILDYFKELTLVQFSLIPDDEKLGIIYNPTEDICNAQNYACGCFWFKKQNI